MDVGRKGVYLASALWMALFLVLGLGLPERLGLRWWLIGLGPALPFGGILAVLAGGDPRKGKLVTVVLATPLLQGVISALVWLLRGVSLRPRLEFLVACVLISTLMWIGWRLGLAGSRTSSPTMK